MLPLLYYLHDLITLCKGASNENIDFNTSDSSEYHGFCI
jgi:hypothetical protein